jgi:hypothetical protein
MLASDNDKWLSYEPMRNGKRAEFPRLSYGLIVVGCHQCHQEREREREREKRKASFFKLAPRYESTDDNAFPVWF